jgi:hypothetical protein
MPNKFNEIDPNWIKKILKSFLIGCELKLRLHWRCVVVENTGISILARTYLGSLDLIYDKWQQSQGLLLNKSIRLAAAALGVTQFLTILVMN